MVVLFFFFFFFVLFFVFSSFRKLKFCFKIIFFLFLFLFYFFYFQKAFELGLWTEAARLFYTFLKRTTALPQENIIHDEIPTLLDQDTQQEREMDDDVRFPLLFQIISSLYVFFFSFKLFHLSLYVFH